MLAGRSYVLVGGASGIGLATAHRLLDRGARVLVVDRSAPPDSLIARGAAFLRSESADAAETEALVRRVLAAGPRLSGVIACVGLTVPADLESAPEAWDLLLRTGPLATIGLVQGLLPALEVEAGASGAADVVILGSAPEESPRGVAAHGTGSAALRAFTSHLRTELAPRGIRAAYLSAGPVPGDARPASALLTPQDCAAVVEFVLQQPPDIAVDDIALVSTLQHRR